MNNLENFDAVNPDWNLARNHGLSTLPGIWVYQGQQNSEKLCPCCHNPIQKQSIPLNQNTKQLGFLGFGVPLFYQFLKNCILMLGVYVGTYAAISICWAVQHNQRLCEKLQTSGYFGSSQHHQYVQFRHNFKSQSQNVEKAMQIMGEQAQPKFLQCQRMFIKLSRTETFISNDQIVLRVVSFIIQLCLLLYGKQQIRFITEYYDQINTNMSDFSILLRCSKRTIQLQDKIKRFFKSSGLSSKDPVKILVLPNIQQIQQQEELKGQLQKQYSLLKLEYEQDISQLGRESKKILMEEKKRQYQECCKKLEDLIHSYQQSGHNYIKEAFINKAIIIMPTEFDKQSVLEKSKQLNDQQVQYFFDDGNRIYFSEAPQPRDINWEHIHSTYRERYLSYIKGCCLSFLFVAVYAIIFYFILCFKTDLVDQIIEESQGQQQQVSYKIWLPTVLVVSAMLLVVLLNKFVMGKVLHIFCHMEQHETGTSLQFSFALKYSLGMFFTTALMTLAVQAIRFDNFYQNYFGVIQQESIMFFMTTFLVPIIWSINPFDLAIRLKRKIFENSKKLTQRQANQLMESFSYDIGKRYAEILKVVWFTYLYSTLIPIGAPLTVLGIFLYYWVDKYNLLRKSSIKQQISGNLSPKALKLLDLSLIFIPLGQIFFDYFMRKTYTYWSIGCLVIAVIYFFLPSEQILTFFIAENFKLQEKTFNEAFKRNDYELFHPLYRHLLEHKHTHQHMWSLKKDKLNDAMKIKKKKYEIS